MCLLQLLKCTLLQGCQNGWRGYTRQTWSWIQETPRIRQQIAFEEVSDQGCLWKTQEPEDSLFRLDPPRLHPIRYAFSLKSVLKLFRKILFTECFWKDAVKSLCGSFGWSAERLMPLISRYSGMSYYSFDCTVTEACADCLVLIIILVEEVMS